MRQPAPLLRLVIAVVVVSAPMVQSTPASAADFLQKVSEVVAAPFKASHRQPPPTIEDCAVERLAAEIDWLERHIDTYGSIVAKHPDVWGQSRLMRHRVEYEDQLKKELDKFKERNNASIRRSDQSYLEMLLAIDAATGAAKPSTSSGNSSDQKSSALSLLMMTTGTSTTTGIDQSKPFATLASPATKDIFGLEDNLVGLEPTIHLDHLSRYLNHLHQLRRVNEGDDIADSPGYSLNLVRIPVSVLPGERTKHGHGAEITIIADPMLGDDLLPTTFRNLVSNDLVDQLAPPLTFVVNDSQVRGALEGRVAPVAVQSGAAGPAETSPPVEGRTRMQLQLLDQPKLEEAIRQRSLTVSVPSTKTRRARLPLPGEHILDVVGVKQMNVLIAAVHEALANHPANKPCIEYTDVRSFFQEELDAAHELLNQPAMAGAWAELPSWNLPAVIRGLKREELERIRCAFFASLGNTCDASGMHVPAVMSLEGTGDVAKPCCNETTCRHLCETTTGVLAWMILVESALLNERLAEDMRQAASAKGVISSASGPWSGPYYGPDPGPEARRSFNDYIQLRWPIRVFALDPISQEQNVEDMFAMRREMQIAMAMAARGSRINTQAMMQYARRLETDMATIALNKTAVGFTHGSDTFGWRFYPRVQTPPTRNNIVNFAETLVGSNSRRRDLADRAIEPGIRECTAIIVMPSFVPYVNFEVRTNWFALNHPKHTDQSMRQAMLLSRSVKAMQMTATECIKYAGAYRDGEVVRLLRRVEQLDRELPLQSMLAQIPYENTSGGFELFNTGVTDLAPELIGWYGAEGIADDSPTALYIVGNGFSVHDTTIVAGGQKVDVELISRQVLRATFPKGLKPSKHHGKEGLTGELDDHANLRSGRCKPDFISTVPAVGLGGDQESTFLRLASDTEQIRSPPPEGNDPPPHGDQSYSAPSPPADTPAPPNTDPGDGDREQSYTVREFDLMVVPGGVPSPGVPSQHSYCNSGDMIDVHLATPYGVSNHLLIPFLTAEKGDCCTVPDVAECALGIIPKVEVKLQAIRKDGANVQIQEFFDVTPDTIVVRVPKWFTPPSEAVLRWTVRDVVGSTVVAQFAVPAPQFDASARSYVFDGAELRNFIGAGASPASDKTLRGAVLPYLQDSSQTRSQAWSLIAKPVLVSASQTIPIEGELGVSISTN
jgi:hypothetical protein